MDISFIILNYKSEKYLADCVASIKKHVVNLSYEIIIVNNDPAEIKTIKQIENITIKNRHENSGFAKACNSGAKTAKGNVLFFLNPDTIFQSGNIHDLISILNKDHIGIAAPLLVLEDKTVQPWSFGNEISFFSILKNKLAHKKIALTNDSFNVSWVSGCALAIKKKLFEEINGFDENFFMYFEDVDLCKRVSDIKKRIVIIPSIKILHFGGQSFSSTKKQKSLYYASQDYYFKKHFGYFQILMLKFLRGIFLILKNI